jgi:hypothetical protein
MITTESKGPKAVPDKEEPKAVVENAKPAAKPARKATKAAVDEAKEMEGRSIDSTKKDDPEHTAESQLKGLA